MKPKKINKILSNKSMNHGYSACGGKILQGNVMMYGHHDILESKHVALVITQ